MKTYIYIAASAAFLSVVVGAYMKGRNDVHDNIRLAQQEGKIKVLMLVDKSDEEIDSTDAASLCAVLGGCDVSNDSSD